MFYCVLFREKEPLFSTLAALTEFSPGIFGKTIMSWRMALLLVRLLPLIIFGLVGRPLGFVLLTTFGLSLNGLGILGGL